MDNLLIVGGGISGLLASYTFKQYSGVRVSVMTSTDVGGEFGAGGLKYIHKTEEVLKAMKDLDIIHSSHNIRGGVLLQEKVEPYPSVLGRFEKPRALRIRRDLYLKTRHQEPEEFSTRSALDPEDVGIRKAVRFEYQEFVSKLSKKSFFVKERMDLIHPGFVTTTSGNSYRYTHLVLTIPLWSLRNSAYFHIPEGHAVNLNVVNVQVVRDLYTKWDYVHTPYTPGNAIHRISPVDGGYQCEVNGVLDRFSLISDLNFIFKHGWSIDSVTENLKGSLLPLSQRPEWPDNIAPIGRFATWDPKATPDVVIDDCRRLAEIWGWRLSN